MIQVVSLLLCFESSELFKEREEQPMKIRNQISSPLAGCKGQNQVESDFPIQRHDSYPKPLYNYLIPLKNHVYMLQDPFVQFLDLAKEISNFLVFSKVNTAISDCKISILSTSKHKQQKSLMYIMLKWLHWLFHFT